MSRKYVRIGTAAMVASLLAAAAHGQEEAGAAGALNIPENITVLGQDNPNVRRATAMVNGTIITGTDVDQRVALVVASNEQPPSAEEMQRLRLQVFRSLIDETLQIQEATALELQVTPEEVNETYARLANDRFNGAPAALDAYLLSIGSSPASLKRQIQGQMSWDRLLRRNVAPFVNVSSGEVDELFERTVAARGTAEYRVGEIYLSATPATREAVAQNAQRIVEQLRQGGDFIAFARQFSESTTARVGGDLGWIRLEQLQNPQLEATLREMSPGQLAGPLEIPGGFDILYLIDKRQIGVADPRDATVSLKQISIEFPEGTTEEQARTQVASFQQGVANIRGCGEANAAASAMGAAVVDNEIVIKELPEVIQQWLLQLNIGQTTPPFGDLADGVRVLVLCGRDEPEVDGGPDREQIMATMEEDRINKRAERYLRDLRRDAVIDYN